MDLKKLFMNNKAVSPVIGVILMVAITVILAAAIGSSVFGQGTAESAPQANLDIKAGDITVAGATPVTASVKIEHLGGDPIDFTDSSKVKVTASVNGDSSVAIDATSLAKISVGDVSELTLTAAGTGTDPTVATGDTVNIKVIDAQTSQLICDKNVRF